MNKSTSDAAILSVTLDRSLALPLQAQLTQALRGLVHEGRLRSGDRLPASRALADELAVSRVTVTAATDQLIAEGYLIGRRGSGVFVADDLPDLPIPGAEQASGAAATARPHAAPLRPFEVGVPDLESFPYGEWARLLDQAWRRPERALLMRQDARGWPPLREAVAAHLASWRGLRCDPDQIVITSGLAEALELVGATFLTPGDTVLVEDPGYGRLRRTLAACDLRCEPVAVDEDGFDIGAARVPARAVAVTPSRHFPLGMTMPLARRLALLAWAVDHDGFILEDDFDGEYRFGGQPLPAMMGLDDNDRVIYIGSFSKVLFPALRLAFAVFPRSATPRVSQTIAHLGPRASIVAQPALARFIAEGGFATHIRRMRRLYADRQASLADAIGQYADDLLDLDPTPGGMHAVATLRPGLAVRISDVEASRRAAAAGIRASALSSYYAGPVRRTGLVLGYAPFGDDELRLGVRRLGDALRDPR